MKQTKKLDFIKQKISKKINVGVSRIRFNSESLKQIYDQNKRLNQIVKVLINERSKLRIIPKKRRLYKIVLKEKKKVDPVELKKIEFNLKPNQTILFKKYSSLRYLKDRKIVTDKDIWIKKVREYRKILRENKCLLGKYYRRLRNNIKSDKYPSRKEFLADVNRFKCK